MDQEKSDGEAKAPTSQSQDLESHNLPSDQKPSLRDVIYFQNVYERHVCEAFWRLRVRYEFFKSLR